MAYGSQQATAHWPKAACHLFWYDLRIKNGFLNFKWLEKNKKSNVSWHTESLFRFLLHLGFYKIYSIPAEILEVSIK